MSKVLFVASVVMGAVLVPSSAEAHDYWLAPEVFVVPAPRPVSISLRVGDGFESEVEKAYERGRYPRAELIHRGRSQVLANPDWPQGAKPIFRASPKTTGGHLVVVDRNASEIELAPKKFEKYLRRQGLRSVLKERAKRGESKNPGRERYRRCLKALIQVGQQQDRTFATRTGQTLEIIPQSNPAFAKPGDPLKVRVEFKGEPLADAKVTALVHADGKVRTKAYRTDSQGMVTVKIDRRGVWMIRLVHMIRCAQCEAIDWDSFWTSYVFENGGIRAFDDSNEGKPKNPD